MASYLPTADGETHINVYSKGKTTLGKMLSNFYEAPTEIDFYDEKLTFKTLEGFWYFYVLFKATKQKNYEFCELSGYESKKLGKEKLDELPDEEFDIAHNAPSKKAFKARFQEALKSKLRQNKNILNLLTASELPFAHYYYYGDEKNPKVIDKSEYNWMLDTFNEVREIMKNYVANK